MKPIKALTISDKHIGNNRNPARRMVKNIKETIGKLSIEELDELDFLIDLGDSTDSLLSTRSEDYGAALEIHLHLARTCVDHNITYLYLMGTPLHEMGQFFIIEKAMREAYPRLKMRIYSDIGIDRLEEYDLNILHIPDEIIKDNELYEARVNELTEGVKVDLILTHTIYDHQLNFKLPSLRSSEFILSKTEGYVLNGHVHTHSIKDRLITVGSSDRISHGEEEEKGLGLLSFNYSDLDYYKFIKNDNALTFIAVRDKISIARVKAKLLKMNKTFDLSYLQLSEETGISMETIKELNVLYPKVRTERAKKSKRRKTAEPLRDKKEPLEITPENIIPLLSHHMADGTTDEFIRDVIGDII